MHATQLSLARHCTTNHHAGKRRAAVWSALLSVLILTAAVVAPAAAAPPGGTATPGDALACADLSRKVRDAYKSAGASDATAEAEANRAYKLCMERKPRK